MNLKKGSFFLLISTSWFIFMKIGIRKRIYWVYSVNWSCICSQMLWKIESECFQWDSFAWKRLTLKRSSLKYTTKLGIYWPVELKKKKVQKYNWNRSSKILSRCHFFHIYQLYIFLCGHHFQEGYSTFLERCSSSPPPHSATLGLYPTDFKIQQKILRDSRIPTKMPRSVWLSG